MQETREETAQAKEKVRRKYPPELVLKAWNYLVDKKDHLAIRARNFLKRKNPKTFEEEIWTCSRCGRDIHEEFWAIQFSIFEGGNAKIESIYCIHCVDDWVEIYENFLKRTGGK